jgi:tetratricopeptide (TPR) repeat protein
MHLLQVAAGRISGDAATYRTLAQAAMRLRDAATAITLMEQACGLAPDDPALHFQFDCLLAHEGQHAQAIPHFRRTLAQQPEHAQAWFLLGITWQRLGRHAEALPALRHARGLGGGNDRIIEALAEAEFHAGYSEDALPLWEEVLRTRPDDENAILRMAESLNRLGRHEEALTLLRQAVCAPAGGGPLDGSGADRRRRWRPRCRT